MIPLSFPWHHPVAGNAAAKLAFHNAARHRLARLAAALGLDRSDYDLRSNMAGPAVSGEITLHAEHLYVQVSQTSLGPTHGILMRRCAGRRDYTGEANHFESLHLLDDPQRLAAAIDELGLTQERRAA